MDIFDDWTRAIFVSPSIFYAGYLAYAKKWNHSGITYSVLVQTRIKPDINSEHPPIMVKYAQKMENLVECRIEIKDDFNLIMIIESENNVSVTGILFARTDFLENIKDYYNGEIFVIDKSILYFKFHKKLKLNKIIIIIIINNFHSKVNKFSCISYVCNLNRIFHNLIF